MLSLVCNETAENHFSWETKVTFHTLSNEVQKVAKAHFRRDNPTRRPEIHLGNQTRHMVELF
jgi:hypothetical protein